MTEHNGTVVVEVRHDFGHQSSEWQIQSLQSQMCDLTNPCKAFDLECDHCASCAVLESITVQDVLLSDDSIDIHYKVVFSEWHPCLMEQRIWSFQRQVRGTFHSDKLTLPIHIGLPRRSTCDEF